MLHLCSTVAAWTKLQFPNSEFPVYTEEFLFSWLDFINSHKTKPDNWKSGLKPFLWRTPEERPLRVKYSFRGRQWDGRLLGGRRLLIKVLLNCQQAPTLDLTNDRDNSPATARAQRAASLEKVAKHRSSPTRLKDKPFNAASSEQCQIYHPGFGCWGGKHTTAPQKKHIFCSGNQPPWSRSHVDETWRVSPETEWMNCSMWEWRRGNIHQLRANNKNALQISNCYPKPAGFIRIL